VGVDFVTLCIGLMKWGCFKKMMSSAVYSFDHMYFMLNLNKIYLYRMTHIENIPHILQYGVTHMSSKNANKRFVSIGDKGLINTRSRFLLNNGRRLGEYIPFYFGVRTPMLYVMQKGFNMLAPIPAENIVYCVSSV